MRRIRNLAWAAGMAFVLGACFKAPIFPDTPSITFNKIEFTDVADPSTADTLILTINFKDGDGDLGLSQEGPDLEFPYNDRFYFLRNGGIRVPNLSQPFMETIDPADVLHYASRKTAPYDTLPPYVSPYNCENWGFAYDTVGGQQQVVDTLYFQLNPNQNNIFVDIYVQQPDGSFQFFDWAKEFQLNCEPNGLNARFPILSKDLSQKTGQEGKIRYAMPSVGWNITFSIKVLQIHVWIEDRALHRSNVVITPAFQLQGI